MSCRSEALVEKFEVTAKPKKCTAFLTENGHERKRIPRQQIFEQESVPWCTIRAQGSSLGSMPVLAKNASHFFNAETYAKKFGNEKISGKDGFSEVP